MFKFLLGLAKGKDVNTNPTPLDFVKTKKGILRELGISKESHNVVGVYSKSLGEGMFLTVVEDIDRDATSEVVVFYPYDMSGRRLIRSRISLNEIDMVCPFSKIYRSRVQAEKPVRLHEPVAV